MKPFTQKVRASGSQKPAPTLLHSIAQTNLVGELSKTQKLRVVCELDLELAGRSMTPDLSIIPREPVNFRKDVLRETRPPVTVVEISNLSEDNESAMERLNALLGVGVQSAWFVDTRLQTVTIMLPDGRQQSFDAGVATDPATGLTARVGAVFA